MMEKRMKELESKISTLVQQNFSLESKVESLQGEVQRLKEELNLKVTKSVVNQTIDSLCGQICIEGKEIYPKTALTVNEDVDSVKYSTLEVGKLTDAELKKWSLGVYSKNNTPGSTSL